MRLIDADRLLSEPMKSKYYHLKNGDTAVPLIDIKNAPTVDAVPVRRGKWIPCSERLPETPDRVLVTIDWGDGDYEVSTDEYWSIDGVETEGWGDLHGEVVTAWMPLPEPYKGEQE